MVKKKIVEAIDATDSKTKRWRSLFSAARLAYEAGELRKAETLLARAMEVAKGLTERSFAVHTTEVGWAAVLLAMSRTQEAAKRLTRSISALEGHPDPLYKELLAVALRFDAQAHVDDGDERTAEKELLKSAEILEELGADAAVQLSYTLCDLSGLYLTQKRHSEAEVKITRALKIMGTVLGCEDPSYIRADMIYQTCLPMTGENRMDMVSDGITKMQYSYGAHHPNITRALNRYFAALNERGDSVRLEEATKTFGRYLTPKK